MPAMTVLSAPALATAFKPADVDYSAIAPMLIVIAGALIGVLVEAFAPRRRRHVIQVSPGAGRRWSPRSWSS